MRNLSEYPITTKEKIDALDWAIGLWLVSNKDDCGGVTAVALTAVKQDVVRKFLEEKTDEA